MAGPGKKSKPSAQEQRPVETPEQEKVKDAERALRDVVCWRCQPLRTDQRGREAFKKDLAKAFKKEVLDTDLGAQLLLSHRKITQMFSLETFRSNGQLATV